MQAPAAARPTAILSFDFEDWHQLVHRGLGLAGWDRRGAALERQTEIVLALLDDLHAKATFFVLGLTARRYPDLVREVAGRGHEIASHGHDHRRVFAQTPEEFRRDLERSTELVEELTGRSPRGYRAPAFSINRRTPWAYEVLCDLGFEYDSSQYDSPRIPDRIRAVPNHAYRLRLPSGRELWEFPLAVWRVRGRSIPVGGGAYWRAFPERVLRAGLRQLARSGAHPVLYFHPYELDPEPLRVELPKESNRSQRFRVVVKSIQRNPRRTVVQARVRALAREFALVSHEQARGEVDARFAASSRSLSREGVLV